MSWKNRANADRDALFGGGGGGASKKPASSSAPTATTSRLGYKTPSATGATSKKGSAARPTISAEVKAAKLKEAEDFKKKANTCMERGFFKSADPVAASTYFKRAADCYQQAGEVRMEALYRVESANCNFQCGAWASAAGDYTRAAKLMTELMEQSEDDEEFTARARRDASDYYKKAAGAWTQMDEKAKAAESQVQAAVVLLGGQTLLSKEALAGLEEAVEAHVPDVLNPYARYRQTGRSAFLADGESVEEPSASSLQLAQSHIVTRAYSHEPLQKVVYLFVQHGEYASALYAAGAATVILERDGTSTLSLSRAYCTETILLLAMGDPVAAEERFLKSHVQKTFYLSSRECKLSEELFRAIKQRDIDALEEARSPSGSNRAALANLDESLRTLVTELRVTGVARKTLPGEEYAKSSKSQPTKKASGGGSAPAPPSSAEPDIPLNDLLQQKTGYEKEAEEGAHLDGNALHAELDELDFGDDDDEHDASDDDEDSLGDLR